MAKILEPFEAPIRKLKWARHRAGELNWIMKTFDSTNPVELKQTDGQFFFELTKSYPPEIPLVLGDAIHNLRSSLDLLASDLARLNGKSTKGVYFPFAANATELEGQIKGKNFNRASQEAVALLRKIGPHHEGNKRLRGLHDLDIMDKHQLILPVFQVFQVHHFDMKGPEGHLHADFINVPGTEGPGDGLTITAHPADVAKYESLTCLVGFADDVPEAFRGAAVFQVLEDLAQLVGSVIESFRALYVRPEPDKATTSPVSDNGAVNSV